MNAPDANDLVMAGLPLVDDGEDVGAVAPKRAALPKINVTHKEVAAVMEASSALAGDPDLFVRGGSIVRVLRSDRTLVIVPAADAFVRTKVTECADLVKFVPDKRDKKTGEVLEWREEPQHPPGWLTPAIMALGAWPGWRELRGIVEVPIMRKDGTVLTTRGYDAATGYLLAAEDGGPPVPECPTAQDVANALAMLADVVGDFHWGRPSHRSVWLAAVLTPIAREMIGGPVPVMVFEAAVAGSGKGLAIDCAVRIATGSPCAFESFTTDEPEMKKQLVTWAYSGRRVVVFDEVGARFDGPALRSALTAPVVSGRLLGQSKDWIGENRITWYATGNNIQIGAEMYRRVLHARLVSPVENPETRTGFKYPNLRAHVDEHGDILRACALTVLRAFVVAGRPPHGGPRLGSFEAWDDIVRSAIIWAGWEDPAEGSTALRATDERLPRMRRLVELWVQLLEELNKEACTAKQAVDYACKGGDPGPLPALRDVLTEVACDRSGQVSAKQLGIVLRSLHQRVFLTEYGEVTLADMGTDRTGTRLWRASTRRDAGTCGDIPNPSLRARASLSSDSLPRIEEKSTSMSLRPCTDDDPFAAYEPGSDRGDS